MSEEADAPAIRELDPQTVERIAAGEVVERPASVAKELLENSLDADADRITVAVRSGGKDGIRVTDDGVGMTESAVRRAVEEHTTSKIRDVEDLERGVGTLGFRGEALHAIGAVSRMTITTRPRGGDRGTELRVEGGEVTAVEPAGCPEGTSVEVADLFYNVPARRKFLKQDGTEFAHVNTVVTGYALANPDVRMTLEHDGRETFATTGQGDLESTVMAVYGRDVAEGMIEVDPDGPGDVDGYGDEPEGDDAHGAAGAADGAVLPAGPLSDVRGMVSHPETTRASSEYVATYVNGRFVRSSTVRDAIVDAYGGQLGPDRYPFAVLFLSVPGETVDVNVHPRKREVRFADPDGVAEQVRTAVEDALLSAGLVRTSAPRGRSAPDQTEIAPERSEPEHRDRAAGPSDADAAEPGASDEPDASASTDDPGTPDAKVDDATAGGPIGPGDVRSTQGESTSSPSESDGEGSESEAPGATGRDATDEERVHGDDREGGAVDAGTGRADPHARGGPFEGATSQTRLGENDDVTGFAERASFDQLPAMRVLGQLHDTYLVAETDDGLALIDQHAADERINYERLRESLVGSTATQALADPVELSLTAREAALFAEFDEALARVGFRAERTDDRTVTVRTVPELVAETAGPELIRDVLSAFVTGEAAAAETVDAAADDLIADLACYPSITGNTSLTEGSVLSLLSALDDCENPWACPHGRPVVIAFDRDEIDGRFERDYPGHGGH